MRHGLLRNGLIAAATAVLALASPWAAGARADAAQVTVVSPGGIQQTLSLGALAGSEDVVGRAYALRSAAGESTQTLTGFSLAAILAAAGADPYGFSYLEVQRPAGGAVLLSRDQALDAGAFAEGPPLVYATAAGTGFLRPSSGTEDLNADDCFEAPQGISVVLRKGSRLLVRARASTLRTEPGKPVQFSAVVDRAGSGEQLSYSWYFDDGHSASNPEARHAFAKPGSYDVVLGVTSGGDEAGASAVVRIQVGDAPAGPDRKGGGRNQTAGAPDHGSATGPPAENGGGGSGTAPPVPASPPPIPAPQPEPRDRPTPAPAPAEQRVSGRLVDPSATVAPAPKPAAARRGQLSNDNGGGGVPDAAWGILATLGLLGTGALAEAGGLARVWPRGRAA